MSKITIKDIAKLTGLSASTVSRALADHPDISEHTRNKVKEVAAHFEYQKNIYASFFRNNKSGLISLILPEINMFYFPNLIKSINKIITPLNYNLIISLTNNNSKTESELIEKCINWSVEGVLISLSKETKDLEFLRKLQKFDIPCVLIDKTKACKEFTTVTINNFDSSYDATNYLLQKGHNKILGIFGSKDYSITTERIEGFNQALKNSGIATDNENIIAVENSADVELILPELLRKQLFSAIFTMSDELLAKCIYVINKSGLRIPDDISIITISDGVYPYLVNPNITHIKDSGSKLGKMAANTLLNMINKKNEKEIEKIYVGTRLVELNSVNEIKMNYL